MQYLTEWNNFVARADNFHWDSPKVKQQLIYLEPLYKKLWEGLLKSKGKLENQNKEPLLESLFTEIYTAITMSDLCFTYFLEGAPLYDNVYKACLFTSLCMFLHETTRVKSRTLMSFIYDYSSNNYNNKYSEDYCPLDYPSDGLLNATILLRKQRHRILSARPVYNKRDEWAAMSRDSEYEWGYKYILANRSNTLNDTFKRMGNLYNDINNALALSPNDEFEETLIRAYKIFISKLKKLKYENYLELQKDIFDYICKNNKEYGINLYRIEKELRPYITTQEVNQLLACQTAAEEDTVLEKSAILKDICFPKVYNDLASFACISDVENWSLRFRALWNLITPISCLFIDELIENNRLGEDWYDFLWQRINELAKEVLYNPEDIDYIVTSKSQEKFIKLLSAAAEKEIYDRTNIILP